MPQITPSSIDPVVWNGYITRAGELFRAGKPHRAIADLLRILLAETADTTSIGTARMMLDRELPLQRVLFEQMMPSPPSRNRKSAAGPTKMDSVKETKAEGGVGRSCIYKIEAGSLLFRNSAPSSTTVGKATSAALLKHAARSAEVPKPQLDRKRGPTLLPLPRADVRLAEGVSAAISAARAEHAILIRHAELVPEVASWTGENAAAASVLTSAPA